MSGQTPGEKAIAVCLQLQQLLDGAEWDSGTVAEVATVLNQAGYTIREPEDMPESLAELTEEFEGFIRSNYPGFKGDAGDVLHSRDHGLPAHHREYLEDFCRRWDRSEEAAKS